MDTLQVYNLGAKGIDLVNSPLHVEETTLLHCQNAQLSPEDREYTLKKRDGIAKINSVAAAGRIMAVVMILIE